MSDIPMNRCISCKHWHSDYDFPWGHCQLTWTDLTPEHPQKEWEAKYPESKAHCDMFDFGNRCTEQRALLTTYGPEFGCTQWEIASDHALQWAKGKLHVLNAAD